MKRNKDNAQVKSETKSNVKKAWRFYRSNLSTFVWDQNMGPDGGVLADFSEGHFTTEDKKIANKLKKLGYPEIGLKDTSPPNIIINQSIHQLKDGVNVPIMNNGINPSVAQNRMENITEEIKAPEVV